MSNEVKIGILAIVAIAVGIFGFNFMKGKNIFSNENKIYVTYDNVSQLADSAPVLYNGFAIGTVSNIKLHPDNINKILVTLSVRTDIPIHPNAVAAITNESMMGGKNVQIIKNQPCSGNCIQSGTTLKGVNLGLLNSMVPQEEIATYMSEIQKNIGGIVDGFNAKINDESPDNKIGQSLRDLQLTLANMQASTLQLNAMMRQNASSLKSTLSNVEVLTGTLANNNSKIDSIMSNTATFTKGLSEMNINGMMSKADTTLVDADKAMKQLTITLASADSMVNSLNSLLVKVQSDEGSLGQLMSDTTLYKNISSMTENLNNLATDFKQKPYRYMPLKSRRRVLKHDEKDRKAAQQAGN